MIGLSRSPLGITLLMHEGRGSEQARAGLGRAREGSGEGRGRGAGKIWETRRKEEEDELEFKGMAGECVLSLKFRAGGSLIGRRFLA